MGTSEVNLSKSLVDKRTDWTYQIACNNEQIQKNKWQLRDLSGECEFITTSELT